LLGIYTRISALFLGLHLFGIAFSLGINAVRIRDFGLAVATISVFLNGNDFMCLSHKPEN
jgi:hypothetical protein